MAVQTAPAVAGTDNGPTTATVAIPRAVPGRIVIYEHAGKVPPTPAIVRRAADDGKCELTFFTTNAGQAMGARNVFHKDDPGYTEGHRRNWGCWSETPEDAARARRDLEDREVLAEVIGSLKSENRSLRDRIEKLEAGKPAGKRNIGQAPEVNAA